MLENMFGEIMNTSNGILLFITLWAILDALLAPSTDLFFTVLLIGFMIGIEISDFFINKKSKEILKSINYILIIIFAIIVLNRVREVLVK